VDLILFLAIGAGAGWLAGKLVPGGGYGTLANVAVGAVGAIVGGYLFTLIGIVLGGLLGKLAGAVAGAAVLLFAIGAARRPS
jgi:uncharacterized membrane protein YeaQ/YmgE (transglycosylase-associated protein family)